jgi:hypothetical protein
VTIVVDISEPHAVHIHIDDENWKMFQELVHRAANLWPDAPAEIKRFADEVTIGHVQQEYQDLMRPHWVHYHKCPRCTQVSPIETNSQTPPMWPVRCEKLIRALKSERTREDGTIEVIYQQVVCGVHAIFVPA